jgi:biopolymer transport protein ExbD
MAMSGGGDSGDGGFSDINITPFVDIVLVLLVIFMVTAKYIVSQSIPVELPKAATGVSNGQKTMVSCSIDSKEQMFLDKVPMSMEDMKAALKAKKAQDPELRAIINADRVVAHGKVIELIDMLRGVGIDKFAIQTELPAAAPTGG